MSTNLSKHKDEYDSFFKALEKRNYAVKVITDEEFVDIKIT